MYFLLSHRPVAYTDYVYKDTALGGLVDLVALVACTVSVSSRLGRQATGALSMMLAGLSLLMSLTVVPGGEY